MIVTVAGVLVALLLAALLRATRGRPRMFTVRRLLLDERGIWNPLNAFKDIANGIGAVFDHIKDAFDGFVTFFTLVVQQLVDTVVSGVGAVRDILTWLTTAAINVLTDGFGAIVQIASWLTTVFLNVVGDAAGAIRDILTWLTVRFLNVVSDAAGALRDLSTWFLTIFVNTFGAAAGAIRDLVTWFLTQFVNIVGAIGGQIRDVITWLGTQLVNAITATFGAIVDRVQIITDAIVNAGKSVENLGVDLAAKGIDEATARKKELLELLLAVGVSPELTLLVLADLAAGGDPVDQLSFLGQHAADAGLTVAQKASDTILGNGPISPAEGPAVALALIGAQTALGSGLHGVAVAKEFIPTLDNTATAHLSAFLGEFTGWEHGVRALFHPAVHTAIERPTERLMNMKTSTNIPPEMILDMLLARRKIDAFTYETYHAQHGYDAFWTSHQLDAAYRPLRVFEIARIMRIQDIDDATLQAMLEDAGYRAEFITPLKTALHGVAKSVNTSRIVSESFAAFADGFIDQAQFAADLSLANVQPAEQQVLTKAAQTAYVNKVKTELLAVWRSAAARNAMTDDELRASLAFAGITPAKIEVEVLRAQAARLKKPTADVALAHQKAVNAARTEYAQAYRLQFKKGLIDAVGLLDRLIFVGFDPVQAQAMVTLAQAEAFTPPPVDNTNTPAEVSKRIHADLERAYIDQFHNRQITSAQLQTALVAIGVNALEAATIALREEARGQVKVTTPKPPALTRVEQQVQDTLAAAYLEQLKKHLITPDEYEADLVAIGIDPQVAHARRLLEELRYPAPVP